MRLASRVGRPAATLGLLLALLSPAASAEAAPFAAELGCQPELDSGRLICRVDYRSPSPSRIVWADAVVIEAPPALRPLRSRVPATLAADGSSARAGIALVPGAGASAGTIKVRARAVICAEPSQCRSGERELGADLVVP